ncbi:MAG: GNAT family N-acetyltransferase [Cyanobacteria bacterium P01_A01_bin.135]
MGAVTIRRAEQRDAGAIARFNIAMALETEDKVLNSEVVAAGVNALLNTPALGFYLVAEIESQVVASLMITTEWSDWRNGIFWWVQSVYVEPAFRRQGIYRRMYEAVKELAKTENVCGFRLYVERDNHRAQATYGTLGMEETAYRLFEELRPSSTT